MCRKKLNKCIFVLFVAAIAAIALYNLKTPQRYTNKEKIFENKTVKNDIKILLYTKVGCKYCILAKNLLDKKNIYYEVIELGDNKDLIMKLVNQTGQSTVPYIFIDDNFIGGYQDLKNLDNSGKL